MVLGLAVRSGERIPGRQVIHAVLVAGLRACSLFVVFEQPLPFLVGELTPGFLCHDRWFV